MMQHQGNAILPNSKQMQFALKLCSSHKTKFLCRFAFKFVACFSLSCFSLSLSVSCRVFVLYMCDIFKLIVNSWKMPEYFQCLLKHRPQSRMKNARGKRKIAQFNKLIKMTFYLNALLLLPKNMETQNKNLGSHIYCREVKIKVML